MEKRIELDLNARFLLTCALHEVNPRDLLEHFCEHVSPGMSDAADMETLLATNYFLNYHSLTGRQEPQSSQPKPEKVMVPKVEQRFGKRRAARLLHFVFKILMIGLSLLYLGLTMMYYF
ncbi:hypothetical protein [Pedobacter sp. SYSU D00535]|uniref:hypothetical protein n=1 Tax=Pedobacter sp. SYSU D00535 TaxID=2810308 RepID=UPI001A971583|nr:hypothetical protein [Pedobacter sp. SYSU D00535]